MALLVTCRSFGEFSCSIKGALQCSVRGLQTRSSRLDCSKKPAEAVPKGIPYNKISVGIPKEIWQNERRVAITPAVAATMVKKGFTINVEENAGLEAKFMNDDYAASGAKVVSRNRIYESDIVLKVRPPMNSEAPFFKPSGNLMSFLYPAQNKELVELLAKKQMNVFAMDCVPRISRAQMFDALSSMANIAGYRAVIEAANHFGRFFTGEYPVVHLKCCFLEGYFSC